MSFFNYLSPFCYLLIEFHYTFSISYKILPYYVYYYCILTPPGGSEWIISGGDYVDNSFTALGSSNPREVRLEL